MRLTKRLVFQCVHCIFIVIISVMCYNMQDFKRHKVNIQKQIT